LCFGLAVSQAFVKSVRFGSARPTPNGSLLSSTLGRPGFDTLHQIAPDTSPLKSLVNNQAGNLCPIIRLQELRKNAVNPARQSSFARFRYQNDIAGTREQPPKASPDRVLRRRIAKLAGKPRQFRAILVGCGAYGIA
jgi:hypothetical protein